MAALNLQIVLDDKPVGRTLESQHRVLLEGVDITSALKEFELSAGVDQITTVRLELIVRVNAPMAELPDKEAQ